MELHLFRFGLLLSLFIPVLKFVVQMVGGQLSTKIKMSLKQFFIDLNDSLWFIGSVIRTFIVCPGTLHCESCSCLYESTQAIMTFRL